MPRSSWEKTVGMFTFLGFIAYVVFEINRLTGIDEAQKYFGFTIVLLLAMFVYFQIFKEYPTPRSARKKAESK